MVNINIGILKQLLPAYLWQLMRYNILQLLKNLRSHSNGKEITDVDILEWANAKARKNGSQTRMFSFRVSNNATIVRYFTQNRPVFVTNDD